MAPLREKLVGLQIRPTDLSWQRIPDRDKEDALSYLLPTSEPNWRFSRIRLSNRLLLVTGLAFTSKG